MPHSIDDHQTQLCVQEAVVELMVAVIDGDEALLSSINASPWEMTYQQHRFVFMLPGLYQLLSESSRHAARLQHIAYTAFRRMVYAGDINTRLAALDYQITNVTADEHATLAEGGVDGEVGSKVDSNWYQLVRLSG